MAAKTSDSVRTKKAASTATTKVTKEKAAPKKAASSSSKKTTSATKKTSSTTKKTTTKKAATTKKTTAKKTTSRSRAPKFEGLQALAATDKAGTGKGTLLIVESPTKAASLSKMLKGVTVVASVGHVVDLPKSRMGVDPQKDFEPEYLVMATKQKVADKIVKEAIKAKDIFIASDPDREGEAIAWHLANLLGIDPKSKCRVRMRQITKSAAEQAVAHPDSIDMGLVDAQQARRVLDRLVGYSLSPLLWKKVKFGLSAGRVQSAALSLICEREREIEAFVPLHYWSVHLEAQNSKGQTYTLELVADGKKSLFREGRSELIDSEEKAQAYAKRLMSGPSVVKSFTSKATERKAPAPFKTSTLQQEASRRLRFTPKRTMSIAQKLFEGIDLPDRGPTGLITYMRTDSLRLAPEALTALRDQIKKLGPQYLPQKPRVYQASKNAQDAHEAIRPTDPSLTPQSLSGVLTAEQMKLYDLIWRRTMASQMTDAQVQLSSLTAEVDGLVTKASGAHLVFEGWSKLWPLETKEGALAPLKEGEELTPQKVDVAAKETRPPSRYNEAQLIKVMEELGIGRPSTYAATVSTLAERLYTQPTEDRRLKPTPLGRTVDAFLAKYFGPESKSPIVDTGFTAQMEDRLDQVEEGKEQWRDLMARFWEPFCQALAVAGEGEAMRPPKDFTGEDCPLCGQPLVRRVSRYGTFVGCSNYPACEYIKPNTIGVACPKCGATEGGEVVQRRGKRSVFYSCSRYPDCDYISFDRPTGEKCPECGGTLCLKGRKEDQLTCPSCGYQQAVEEKEQDSGGDES